MIFTPALTLSLLANALWSQLLKFPRKIEMVQLMSRPSPLCHARQSATPRAVYARLWVAAYQVAADSN
jgi:hypothetical protein